MPYYPDRRYNTSPTPRRSRLSASIRGFLDPNEAPRTMDNGNALANQADRLDHAVRDANYEAARQREGRRRANHRARRSVERASLEKGKRMGMQQALNSVVQMAYQEGMRQGSQNLLHHHGGQNLAPQRIGPSPQYQQQGQGQGQRQGQQNPYQQQRRQPNPRASRPHADPYAQGRPQQGRPQQGNGQGQRQQRPDPRNGYHQRQHPRDRNGRTPGYAENVYSDDDYSDDDDGYYDRRRQPAQRRIGYR